MADTPRQPKRPNPRKERNPDAASAASLRKRAKRSLPRPVTPSAFDAAEPLDSKPSAPSVTAPASRAHHVAGLLPYGAGLGVAAILSFSIAATIIFARTSPVPIEAESKGNEIVAENPVPPTQESQSLADIRIVDRPPEERASCEDSAWPYVDKRCLAGMDGETETGKTATSEIKTAPKIGPKPIDSRSPNPLADAQQRDVPIGSLTAIVPARPKVDATDGVATREAPPAEAMAARTVAPRTLASIDRTPDVVKPRKSVHVAEQSQNRAAKVERKKKRHQFADATPRTRYRRIPSERPETPAFFFPFGLFTQAR
jgi:hypothetical protein